MSGFPSFPEPLPGPPGPAGIDGAAGPAGPIGPAGLPGATPQMFSATGITNASGNVTFTFSPAFAATPVVQLAYQGVAANSPVDMRITSLSPSAVTVNVRRSGATVVALLGLTLLGASVPLAGALIHCFASPST